MPTANDGSQMFNTERVEDWAENYAGLVAAEGASAALITGPSAMAQAQVSIVGRDFFGIMFMQFVSGGMWQEDETYALVICTGLAWALFGAFDAAGLTVLIGDDTYTIAGVAESAADTSFAWMPRGNAAAAGLVYMQPQRHNMLTAHLDALALLDALFLHRQNFTIIDINAYTTSINLRGHILFVIFAAMLIASCVRWLLALLQTAKTKGHMALFALFSAGAVAATAYFVAIIDIDIWLPYFYGEGTTAASRLLFNTDLLPHGGNLPANLAALSDINAAANTAFAIGLSAAAIIILLQILTTARKFRKE